MVRRFSLSLLMAHEGYEAKLRENAKLHGNFLNAAESLSEFSRVREKASLFLGIE